MSDLPDNHTPAFPTPDIVFPSGGVQGGHPGMCLRDWFAGKALQGLLADHTYDAPAANTAASAYRYADALMEFRKQGGAK